MGRGTGFAILSILFLFMLGDIESAHALTFDKSVPKSTEDQLLQDLSAIERSEGAVASTLHRAIFGPMRGAGYKSWFELRVLRVGFDPSPSGSAVAYVSPFFDSSKMVLTANYTRFSHPQIARLMIVFHEARHTERGSGHWPHATCPNPFVDDSGSEIKSIWTGLPLAGESACDSSASGAYGSSVILLENIALHCQSCSEKMRMDARLYGDDQMKRLTDAAALAELKHDLYGTN